MSYMFSLIKKVSPDMCKMQERRLLAGKKLLGEVSITEERNYSSIDLHSIKCRILDGFERIFSMEA